MRIITREILRLELEKLHIEKGIKYSWFTDQIGIHRNNISYFMKNKREISDRVAGELEKLISEVS